MNTDLFANSLTVIGQNWKPILAILAFVFWGMTLVFALLKRIPNQDFTDTELIALAAGGWPAPVLLFSMLILIIRALVAEEILFLAAIIIMIVSAVISIRAVWRTVSRRGIFIPIIFFVFVFIRLGFVAGTFLPPYFDSAEHYRIIDHFLQIHFPAQFTWPTASYYHIGYHVIVATLASLTHANIEQVMLIFGQIVLASIPLPIYFFIYRAVNSHAAALFGVILAAFGWFMPAHAVN